jgi:hypothetical protein
MPPHKEQHRTDLTKCDRNALERVLDIVPELRICALALHRRKMAKVDFPITSSAQIAALLEADEKKGKVFERHTISVKSIERFVTPEFFPISDDDELARVVYAALLRCSEEDSDSSVNPKNRDSAPDWVKKHTSPL